MAKKLGTCAICGKYTRMTREHIPPKKAYNAQPCVFYNLFRAMGLPNGKETPFGEGYIKYSLCEDCNNNTGTWYGASYVDWARQMMNIFVNAGGPTSIACPAYIYPLRCFKQVIAMFCSVVGLTLIKKEPTLRKFILDKEERNFPERYRVYTYAPSGTVIRYSGLTGKGDLRTASLQWFAELTTRPLGFVLTSNSLPPSMDLIDITDWHRESYETIREMWISYPVLEVHTVFPGDYRKEEDVKKSYIEALLYNLKLHMNEKGF